MQSRSLWSRTRGGLARIQATNIPISPQRSLKWCWASERTSEHQESPSNPQNRPSSPESEFTGHRNAQLTFIAHDPRDPFWTSSKPSQCSSVVEPLSDGYRVHNFVALSTNIPGWAGVERKICWFKTAGQTPSTQVAQNPKRSTLPAISKNGVHSALFELGLI